eukprot:1371297-Prymnesium_polylepis.1
MSHAAKALEVVSMSRDRHSFSFDHLRLAARGWRSLSSTSQSAGSVSGAPHPPASHIRVVHVDERFHARFAYAPGGFDVDGAR